MMEVEVGEFAFFPCSQAGLASPIWHLNNVPYPSSSLPPGFKFNGTGLILHSTTERHHNLSVQCCVTYLNSSGNIVEERNFLVVLLVTATRHSRSETSQPTIIIPQKTPASTNDGDNTNPLSRQKVIGFAVLIFFSSVIVTMVTVLIACTIAFKTCAKTELKRIGKDYFNPV